VKNISDRVLSDSETSVLAKGLKYAVVPDKPPVVEFVTSTETAIRNAHLSQSDAESLRHKVCTTICNTKLPPSNITKDEREALKDLTKDDSIAIFPADKGKCIVLINKQDYDAKSKHLLKDKKTYKPVGYNPTNGYRKKVVDFTTKLANIKTINLDLKRSLDPASEPTVPAFYGLPKIQILMGSLIPFPLDPS
jgi:hypothetical protein